jgi:hypothetical protein
MVDDYAVGESSPAWCPSPWDGIIDGIIKKRQSISIEYFYFQTSDASANPFSAEKSDKVSPFSFAPEHPTSFRSTHINGRIDWTPASSVPG